MNKYKKFTTMLIGATIIGETIFLPDHALPHTEIEQPNGPIRMPSSIAVSTSISSIFTFTNTFIKTL